MTPALSAPLTSLVRMYREHADTAASNSRPGVMGGLMTVTGRQETGPVSAGTFAIDYLAAMQCAQGTMFAPAAGQRAGRGQVTGSNLLNAAIWSYLQEGAAHSSTGAGRLPTEQVEDPRFQTVDGWPEHAGKAHVGDSSRWQSKCSSHPPTGTSPAPDLAAYWMLLSPATGGVVSGD